MAVLGANGSGLDDRVYGVIRSLTKDDDTARQAMEAAQALTPQPREISGAELALQFFSNMAANASQPGATVLSSAASAVKPTADEYIRQVEANRKAKEATGPLAISLAKALKPDKVTARAPVKVMVDGKAVYMSADEAIKKGYEVATTPSSTGTYKAVLVDKGQGPEKDFMNSDEIKEAKALGYKVTDDKTVSKTKQILKSFFINPDNKEEVEKIIGRPISIDSLGNALLTDSESVGDASRYLQAEVTAEKKYAPKYEQGDRIIYKTDEDAKKLLSQYGVEENDDDYNKFFNLITTDDPDQVGKPVIQAESYVSWFFPRDPDSGLRLVARTPSGSETPSVVSFRRKEIDKLVKIELDQATVANELFPVLDSAMQLLLNDEDHSITGGFQSATLRMRNFLTSAFAIPSSEVEGQKYLEALSNQLGPKMRPVGSGSTSDMEFMEYKQAILSLDQPAKTNYLTMYSLFQRTKNAQEEIRLRKRLIYDGKSEKYIQGKLDELDKGIYEKFTSFAVDPDSDKATNTARFAEERNNWFNSLPNGAVVLNAKDSTGVKPFPNQDTLIIKGW